MPANDVTGPVIWASGGLVWKDGDGGRTVAVVHRRHHGDWTLPKGKCKEGEAWIDAAVREVKEETGFAATPGDFAGSVYYESSGRPKVVLWWNMTAGEGTFNPTDEVDELLWLPVEQAIRRLDHPAERDLLRGEVRVAHISRSRWARATARLSLHLRRRRQSLQRLAASLEVFRSELDYLIAEATPNGEAVPAWAVTARSLLHRAERAQLDGDAEQGWRCFFAALRMELFGMEKSRPEAFKARAQSICNEAATKLKPWRKKTIEDLLMADGKLRTPPNVHAVHASLQVLHEHFENFHRRMRSVGNQLAILSLVTLTASLIAIWVLPPVLMPAHEFADTAFFGAAAMMGVLGAGISGLISLTGGGALAEKIQGQLIDLWIVLARLVVGAAAAIAVCALLLSKLLSLGEDLIPEVLLAAAFAAGFSERLVVRAVEATTKAPTQ